MIKIFCSYYINHYTKTTTWEDPRDRYQQIGKAGSKEKENTRPGADRDHDHPTSTMAPLANQQVATMRRELEAEQVIVVFSNLNGINILTLIRNQEISGQTVR